MPAAHSDRITLEPIRSLVRVRAAGVVIAESDAALRLIETGYPPRCYLPRTHVDRHRLMASDRRTHCPYKGDASYYHVVVADARFDEAAWSYRQPIESMQAIADRIAFDHAGITLDFIDR